jgi:hypothetical protein
MKKMIHVVAALISSIGASTALASEPAKIPPASYATTFISGTATLSDGCPAPRKCLQASTRLRLVLDIGGCNDELGPVSMVQAQDEEGAAIFYVAAVKILNKKSAAARCKPVTKPYSFLVPGSYEKATVNFVGTDVSAEAKLENPAD